MQDDAYLNTVARLEPSIAMIDRDAALASIAVSLRRIADALCGGSQKEPIKMYDPSTDSMIPLTQEAFNAILNVAHKYDIRKIVQDLKERDE